MLVPETERLVRDGEHRDEPEAALIRALQPLVVDLLVRRRVPGRPPGEVRRPEVRLRVVPGPDSHGVVEQRVVAVEELLAAIADVGRAARRRHRTARIADEVPVRAVVGAERDVDVVVGGIV